MNWFMKLSLAKKLLSAFFTLALVAAGMGLYALNNIVAVGNSMSHMYENNLVAGGKAQHAYAQYLIYTRTALRFLAQEGEEQENTVKRAIEYRQIGKEAFDDYLAADMLEAVCKTADKIQARHTTHGS